MAVIISFFKVRFTPTWSSPPGEMYEPVAEYVPSLYAEADFGGLSVGVVTGAGVVVGGTELSAPSPP